MNTIENLPYPINVYYIRTFLMRARPALVHLRYAQNTPVPKKEGETVKWRKYLPLSLVDAPLSKTGDVPEPISISVRDITTVLNPWGAWTPTADWVDLTQHDREMTEIVELLGEQAAETLDRNAKLVLASGANIHEAAAGVNGNTPTEITATDIKYAELQLMLRNAKTISEIVSASTGVGTTPVRAAYFAIINTELRDDLEACAGFLPVSKYPNTGAIVENEWGTVGNVRFIMTTVGYKDTSVSPNVYFIPIMAANAYGTVDIGGVNMIMKSAQQAGGPLNQFSTAGWKLNAWGARILQEKFLEILKVTKA